MTTKHDVEVASWGSRDRARYEQELLRMMVAARIENLMEDLRVSRAELARRLEKTRPWVTKLLSGSQNVTLDTLAEVALALGVRWENYPVEIDRRNTPAANDPALPDWVCNVRRITKGMNSESASNVVTLDDSENLAGQRGVNQGPYLGPPVVMIFGPTPTQAGIRDGVGLGSLIDILPSGNSKWTLSPTQFSGVSQGFATHPMVDAASTISVSRPELEGSNDDGQREMS